MLGSVPENQGETERLTLAKLRSVVSLYEKRGSEGARERGSEGARERGSEGARERGSEGARERGS